MAKNIILGFDPMYQRPENADGAAWRDVLAGSVEGWIRRPLATWPACLTARARW